MTNKITNRDILSAFAAGQHGPLRSNSGSLQINQGGELQSYGTPIIRRDRQTRTYQVTTIGLKEAVLNPTLRKHISDAQDILDEEGWRELVGESRATG